MANKAVPSKTAPSVHRPMGSHRFEVTMEDRKIGFRSVAGIKLSAAFEPLQVGGANTAPVLLPIPVKDTGRITLERGVAVAGDLVLLVPGKNLGIEMQITIYNELAKPAVTYSVAMPLVESVELSKLDATDSSVLIATMTILHHGICVL